MVYDENGKIKREPTFLQKGWEKIKPFISPFSGAEAAEVGKSQTPLPETPPVDQQLVASVPQVDKQTGLTHTENALLSNEEKAIRLRQRGMA